MLNRLSDKTEAQGERLKRLIDEFYPDGVRAEFAETPQIGKTMMNSPAARRFLEDRQTLMKCLKIIEDVRKIESESIEIDFYCISLTFKNTRYCEYNACVMFKVNPEDTPIYVHEVFVMEGVILRFLVDSEEKEAFLVLDDFDCRDGEDAFNGSTSSFIPLSEFHAILSDGHNYYSKKSMDVMVSFSQEEGKFCVEQIYDINKSLTDPLFMYLYDSPNSEDNSNPIRNKYDRQFKLAAIKHMKENKLSLSQAAKELGVSYNNLRYWVLEYERLGENAFPGDGKNQKMNTPTQDEAVCCKDSESSPALPNGDKVDGQPLSDNTDIKGVSSDVSVEAKDAPILANNDVPHLEKKGNSAKIKPKDSVEDVTPADTK